jgi:hypothetical protein
MFNVCPIPSYMDKQRLAVLNLLYLRFPSPLYKPRRSLLLYELGGLETMSLRGLVIGFIFCNQ